MDEKVESLSARLGTIAFIISLPGKDFSFPRDIPFRDGEKEWLGNCTTDFEEARRHRPELPPLASFVTGNGELRSEFPFLIFVRHPLSFLVYTRGGLRRGGGKASPSFEAT
ncbi:hypothetical protein E2C01_087825 [Portunus trituberculatus]|uniref:Uncharacterized protein n=1 Tax=Portunus trituberculatus TaxID=210409 RepID=A0A5B7JCW3_PORTR|nr:hypothetical protein [Portunus trituberculatus]